jgi:hypothetical protein
MFRPIRSEEKNWIELGQNVCEEQDLTLVASKLLYLSASK